jgi:hypothetical protein
MDDPPTPKPTPTAIPSTIQDLKRLDGDYESLAALLTSAARGIALRRPACDALFTEDDWTPRSATIVAGSVFAVALAANPALVGEWLSALERRRWTMSVS